MINWGTYITTPEINAQSASVNLEVKIKNSLGTGQNLEVKTEIYDPNNQVIADADKEVVLADSVVILTQEFAIANPVLWSIASPSMYKAVTSLYQGEKLIDRYETPLGIRFF